MSGRVYRARAVAPRGRNVLVACVVVWVTPACTVEQDPGPIRRSFLESRAEAAARYQHDLERELEATRVRIARLEKDLEASVTRENELVAELSTVLDSLTTLETNLVETRAKLEASEGEKRVAEARLEQVRLELAEFLGKTEEAEAALEAAKAKQAETEKGGEGKCP